MGKALSYEGKPLCGPNLCQISAFGMQEYKRIPHHPKKQYVCADITSFVATLNCYTQLNIDQTELSQQIWLSAPTTLNSARFCMVPLAKQPPIQ